MSTSPEEYADIAPDMSSLGSDYQGSTEVIPTSSDVPAAAEEPTEVPKVPAEPIAPVEQPPAEEEADELPEDPTKQREAFIKMRQQLREQQRLLEQQPVDPLEPEQTDEPVDTTLLDELLTYQPTPALPPNRLDPTDPFNQAVNEQIMAAHAQAQEARQRAASMEARLEKMEAESNFPTLKTDKYFRERVEEKLIVESLKATQSGKPRPSMSQIAKKINAELQTSRTQLQNTVRQEVRTELTQPIKQQTSGEGRTSSANVDRTVDTSHLSRRINKGDRNALVEALLSDELSGLSERDLGFYR